MSDQDNPPPTDGNSPGQDVPPPIQEPAAARSFSTVAPPVGNVGLGQGKLSKSDEKTMGMLAHVLGTLTAFVGPLLIWLIKKDESPFVNDQGKEALNFQITVAIAYIASGMLSIIVSFVPFIGGFVGCITFVFPPAIWIASVIFSILGGIEANKGVAYRYPFALRLIS